MEQVAAIASGDDLRSRGGFTIIEVLVAVAVGVMSLMCAAMLLSAAARAMESALSEVPMAMATANAATLLRHRLNTASCIQTPAAGGEGSMLIGYVGRFGPGCADAAQDADAPPPAYFVFCRASTAQGEKLLLRSGIAADGPIARPECGDTGGDPWHVLTPLNISISSCRFRRPAGGAEEEIASSGNQVDVLLKFEVDGAGMIPAGQPMGKEVVWESIFTTLAPMDAP